MASGFSVKEYIAASPDKVWSYLTDFDNAQEWMPGIDNMSQPTGQTLETGTVLTFHSRGKSRKTLITAFDREKKLALTSTQGGVTATYKYKLGPSSGGTEITLDASCKAGGFWKLLHPLIVIAMKKADSPQLANLKAIVETSN